MQLAHRRRC